MRLAFTACLAVLFAVGVAAPLRAQEAPLRVERPWARPSPGRVPNGAAYMTLVNPGAAPDRLVRAESPVADKAELHTHVMDGNVMRMRQVTAVDLPAGGTAKLEPGGLHVMLLSLKAPLMAGEEFPLTLVFEKAGMIEVRVKIGPPPGG